MPRPPGSFLLGDRLPRPTQSPAGAGLARGLPPLFGSGPMLLSPRPGNGYPKAIPGALVPEVGKNFPPSINGERLAHNGHNGPARRKDFTIRPFGVTVAAEATVTDVHDGHSAAEVKPPPVWPRPPCP